MLLKKFSFFILLFALYSVFSSVSYAQDTTTKDNLHFSLLTCDAGDDLYTIWGHTAIRVTDSTSNVDIVYNFGSFDFNEPNFIFKFVKGNLLYFISADSYKNFMYEYQYFGRNVHEQLLNLSTSEKQKWLAELQNNMIGDNRFYLYNFIRDNCTTRVKDGLFKHAPISDSSINIHSFREEVVSAPYKGGLPWIGVGIDLLLGAVSDQKPNHFEEAFLPRLLYEKVTINAGLIKKTKHYTFNNGHMHKGIMPIYIFAIFFVIYIACSTSQIKYTQKIASFIDVFLLFTFGIAGILITYMSLLSMHTACHQNFNIIWLHPFYLIALVTYFASPKWTSYLGWLFFIPTIILMFTSYWVPQHFSQSVIGVMAIALFLQIRLIKKRSNATFF